MQLVIYNERIRFLLCIILIYSNTKKKDKKGITITNAFQNILDESKFEGNKTSKLWVYKSSEFYNRSMKLWLQDNNTEMYSTCNEGKSVAAERFITKLKNKIYKYMTAVSKKCIFIN